METGDIPRGVCSFFFLHLNVDSFIREVFVIGPTDGLVRPGRQLHRRVRSDRVGVSAEISAAIDTGTALWFTVARPILSSAGVGEDRNKAHHPIATSSRYCARGLLTHIVFVQHDPLVLEPPILNAH